MRMPRPSILPASGDVMWLFPAIDSLLGCGRNLRRLSRVPPWVKLADFLPIYAERAALGSGYEGDHVIPLNGELVSGLHVPGNLQIPTREQNRAKGSAYNCGGMMEQCAPPPRQ